MYYGYTEDLMVLLVKHFLLCSGDWIYAGKTNQDVTFSWMLEILKQNKQGI